MEAVVPVVAVHGGAWDIPAALWEASLAGVKFAALRGYHALEAGSGAVAAVEAAVNAMEDDPAFDAGCGSVLTSCGTVEGCALIMEGSELRTGAVAAVTNLQNPISVARLVMDKTPHAMLAGEGGNNFAASEGVLQRPVEELITEEARRQLELYRKYKTAVSVLFNGEGEAISPLQSSETSQSPQGLDTPPQLPSLLSQRRGDSPQLLSNSALEVQQQRQHDTVGCVVVDKAGRVACGTSTGGITNQLPGRVGDSPMVGCGGYADDEAGAVSTTGHGESLIKVCLAHRVVSSLRTGLSCEEAGSEALDYMLSRVGGRGGAVIVSNRGDVAAPFTTARMPWAFVRDGALHWGMHPGDHFVEALPLAAAVV